MRVQRGNEGAMKAAMRELSVFRELPRHSNVVGYFDGAVERNGNEVKLSLFKRLFFNILQTTVMILMEQCPLGSVFGVLSAQLTLEQGYILDVFRDTAMALAHFHAQVRIPILTPRWSQFPE